MTPLSVKARASVLDYVVKRLDLPPLQIVQGAGLSAPMRSDEVEQLVGDHIGQEQTITLD